MCIRDRITPKAYVDSNVEILPQSNTLQIELDELTTIQRDVTVTTSGTPADGYAVGSTSCEPSLVTISGPKKILENADRLVVSVNVEGDVYKRQGSKSHVSFFVFGGRFFVPSCLGDKKPVCLSLCDDAHSRRFLWTCII